MASDEDAINEERIIEDSGIDARVGAIIEPVLEVMGFQLVRVRLSGQNGMTLQVMAQRPDGTISVEDCEELSRAISPALDVDDPIEGAYHLEVSSPGIDRPMVRKSDFFQWQGHLVRIETAVLIDGRKRFRGKITAVNDDGFDIENERAGYGEEAIVTIPFDSLSEARLILTDDLVRDALRRDKKVRQELKKNRRLPKALDNSEAGEETQE